MAAQQARPVVVAVVDATTAAATARTAAVEAAAHHRPLTVLHGDAEGERLARLGIGAVPSVRASYRRTAGDLDEALVDASRSAYLVVTTADSDRRAAARRVAAHAASPTLIAYDGRFERWRPVVLAVDARAGVSVAAAFAYAEAAARGVELSVLYVAPQVPDGALDTVDPFAYDAGLAVEAADRLLAEALAGRSAAYPDVPVHRRTWHDPDVVRAVAQHADKAGLLVVAARDHPLLSERLLGSVTAGLVGAVRCPLAVVPADRRVQPKEANR